MNQKQFELKMHRAKTLQSVSTKTVESAYWVGYMRGLRRAYHRENFGTESEHNKWMSLINEIDEQRKQMGIGYRAGLVEK